MSGTPIGVGERVAVRRKLSGLTQEQLANRAHVSASLLRKVEQGSVPASSAFTSAVAKALSISVSDLLDLPPQPQNHDDNQMLTAISPLRRELITYRQPPQNESGRTLDELAVAMVEVSRLRHATDYFRLGSILPMLLADLLAATHDLTGSDRERAFGLLAEAYDASRELAYCLGYSDLSSLAIDRYEWAAAQSGDGLSLMVGDYHRAGELLCLADHVTASALLERSRSHLEVHIGRADVPTLAMYGNLHLKSALVAARAGNRIHADEHLKEARETAERIGADRDDYRLCFGPTNVRIWSVALAVEAGDGPEAVKRSRGFLLPPTVQRERAGHHWIDLSRGYLLAGDREASLASLMTARQIIPQRTRFHRTAAETVLSLARAERRRSDMLRSFASWMGLNALA
ncbi:MAG: helix-turn-helix domain-containing protein [Pseudonocardiaceae bacterium]